MHPDDHIDSWEASHCTIVRRDNSLTDERRLTKEDLLAQEVLVVLQKLSWVSVLLDGGLGAREHHHIDVVHLPCIYREV